MRAYEYNAIDSNGSALRLIRLFKGSFADDIRCELLESYLHQTKGIPYEALSYTWGSTEKTANIRVNGCTMGVTENLYVAMQHLRSEDQDRILWIDAICINQANHPERRHQVQQMRYIYQKAEQVVIWLGIGTFESDIIMNVMNRVHENAVGVEGDWRRSAELWMPTPNTQQLEYLKSLLDRPWFRRIWVLQEIASARAALVVCGRQSVSARTFAQFPSLLNVHPDPRCQAVLDIMPGFSRKESWWNQNRNLHTLLVKFRQSEATDPRDIVYALLGISQDAYNSDFLNANYEKSVQQVIRDTTSFLLSHPDPVYSRYEFLDWEMPEFLDSLDLLSNAVLEKALENEQEVIVNWLIKRPGVNINLKDDNGRTPLMRATERGHETMVKQLLTHHDIEIDSMDNDGRTALSRAAQGGHKELVQLLVERGDVKAGSKDKEGRTPLLYAAERGYEAMVEVPLTGAGVEVNSKDQWARTPLSYAAEQGCDAVVNVLLTRSDVNANSTDINGRTPLSWAAERRREAVVELLLAHPDIEAGLGDNIDRTPLSWAIGEWHKATAKRLMEWGVFKADLKSKDNQMLSTGPEEEDLETVGKLLIARSKPGINIKDMNGRTLLAWAAEQGHDAVVKLLVTRDDVEADSEDQEGRTPLHFAARGGYEAVVKLLVARDDVEADSKDQEGRTPLHFAAEGGHEAVVKLLVARDDVKTDSKDQKGWTSLHFAAGGGHEAVVKLLIM